MTLDAKAIALPLIDALRAQLEEIDTAARDRFTFTAYMTEYGWDIQPSDAQMASIREFFGVSASLAALDEIAEALEGGDPDEVVLIGQSLVAIIEIVERVIAWTGGNHGGLPAPMDGSTNFWNVFPNELIQRLVADGIDDNLGPTFNILMLFGVGGITTANPGGAARIPYERVSLDWNELGEMVSNPVGAVRDTVSWGQPGGFDHRLLFDILETMFFQAGFATRQETPSQATLDLYYSAGNPARGQVKELVLPFAFQPDEGFNAVAELGFKALPIPPAGNMGAAPVGIAVSPKASGAIQSDPDAGDDDWALVLTANALVEDAFRLEFRPTGTSIIIGGGASSVDVGLRLSGQFDPPQILIGAENSHRLEVDGVFVSSEIRGNVASPEIIIRAGTGDGANPSKLRFVFQAQEGDGFLTKIVGTEPQTVEVGGHISFSSVAGIGISGTAGLQIQIPLHLALGPIELQNLNVGTRARNGGGMELPLGIDIKADLGPLQAVISDIGAQMDLVPATNGLFGNLDVEWEFKAPTGIGLSIDAGVVKGGGFLYIDADLGEYAGALELSILEMISVGAIAIITTKNPDGSPGFSLLAAINVEFNPGVQLGFGFTLIGVGGLLGLNRSMDLDAIAQGVKTGSLNSIMFPDDLVANAPRIISDMKSFFPVEEGTFLIGPMLKFGWGTPTLIQLSIGVIIEIPGNIAIVGTLTVAIPDEKAALIIIKVAFVGAIEFDKKRGWFFAVLYDSRVIYMPLEGGMGVLAAFGNDSNFVVTVGGFHPAYNPPALPFPEINRISISILDTPVAKVRVQAYFAVTSNTVQFGARAELYFGISVAKIEGHIAFDALFQFSPFYFIIQISASLSVKVFGAGLFSVRFKGSLEGTSPWHVEGTGSVSLLFWSVSVDFAKTWGEEKNTSLPPISVMPILAAEFAKLENWTAVPPAANKLLVALNDPADDGLILHPIGALTITQRAAPLGITLDKFGNQKPDDADRFSIEVSSSGVQKSGTTEESFAIAQFQELNDSSRLSAADFVKEEAGVKLSIVGSQSVSSLAIKLNVRYEEVVIDNQFKRRARRFVSLFSGLFSHLLGNNSAAKATISLKFHKEMQPFDTKIAVVQAGFVVANLDDNTTVAPDTFASRAQAEEFMKDVVATDPGRANAMHIIRPHEMLEAA